MHDAPSRGSLEALQRENEDLRLRLAEAEDTLVAIRAGEVDALIVGEEIYTLDSAHAAATQLRKDVLAQMEDAVIAFDLSGHVIFMNPFAERQYRCKASVVLGRDRGELFTEEWPDPQLKPDCERALRETGAYRSQTLHHLADGSHLHVESTVTRLSDATGFCLGALAVIRDISARIHAEETLAAASLELSRRERQFSTIVENSPDIFARIDRQHRYLYISPRVEHYTGVPASQFIGRTHAELDLDPELCRRWHLALEEVFTTGAVGRVRDRLRTPDERDCVFDSRLMPVLGEDGGVETVLSLVCDITEQEAIDAALRESRARLQFTLTAARVGEWDLDLETGVILHSLEHDRCFGYTSPITDWGIAQLLAHVHPDDRTRVAAGMDQSLASDHDWDFDCRVIWPDRSVHWIEVHGSIYVGSGGSRRMLGIVVDATDRRTSEEALRDADRRKDEFLATLAHELRNPLAPIRNALQILQLTQENSKRAQACAIIDRQLRQMVHLVDDLLDVSRISEGKVELRRRPVDIADSVQAAIETSRPLIEGGRHRLTARVPASGTLMVEADATRLCQIIANLLNNAAKYTPEGGLIEVIAEPDEDHVRVTVKDSGVGIRADLLPRVFDMFTQVDRTLERSQGGLGIGLALVKKLVEMHGGSVRACSEGPGQGSRFEVRLPRTKSQFPVAANERALRPSPQVTGGFEILVVDDNADSAASLALVLNMWGYPTHTAHDGLEGLRSAETFRPRAAIFDIGLPGMNGLEAARSIRRTDWGRDILLIAASGWGQEADLEKSRQAGFDHHFVKPVDLQQLALLLKGSKLRFADRDGEQSPLSLQA